MFSIAKLVASLASLFNTIMQEFRDRRIEDGGRAKAQNTQLKENTDAVVEATQARDAAAAAVRDVTATGELPDDGFRRD